MFTLGSGHACLSPWGVGQATVSGKRPREDGVCEVWELWFLQAEELVHSFGSVLQKKWPLGLERRDGESLSSVVQLDGLFGFLVAALEVVLMFALCPASNCWSSGGSPVAPVALELGDSPQLSPAQ